PSNDAPGSTSRAPIALAAFSIAVCVSGATWAQASVRQNPSRGRAGRICRGDAARTDTRSGMSSSARTNRPSVSSDGASGWTPSSGSRPKLGLNPITPQYEAGRITDPAVCDPSAAGTVPSATAAAEPLDEPPGVRDGSWGFRVLPGE